MNSRRSRRERTGVTSIDTARDPNGPVRESPFPRPPRAAEGGPRARSAALLPRGRRRARPGRGDGGPRADHARLEQLPRPDHPPGRQAGRPGRARALRHRPDRLALPERHHPAAPGARARDRRVDRRRGRARVHHRLPGQRGLRGDAARAGGHGDRGLGRPRVDPGRRDDVPRPHPAVPPQQARQAREDAQPRRRGHRRRRPGGRRRGVLDGGRPGAAAGDRGAVRALRAPA